MTFELVPSAKKLLDQIDARWGNREKTDLSINDKRDTRRIVVPHALGGSDGDADWLSGQIAAYCKNKKAGSVRVSTIFSTNEVASGTHPGFFWKWRTWNADIGEEIHILFSSHGEKDAMEYDIPILVNGESGIWNEETPFYDRLINAIERNDADRSVWNLACRLKELGFIESSVLPEGKQTYPKNAIRMLQDYMGLERTPYNEDLHWKIWGELRLSYLEP